MPAPPPLRPLLPLAKRLNRNALIVSAVIMGMTVLTAVVVVHPSREAHQHPSPQPAVDEAPSTPSRPTFLEEPVRGLRFATVTPSAFRDLVEASQERMLYTYRASSTDAVSIIAPSLMFEELEIQKVSDILQKPPIVPSPLRN